MGSTAVHSTRASDALGAEREAREEAFARLYKELEKAQLRAEEVADYYRGELEAVRRRAEEETIRLQAAEVSRRKRAEDQVVYLKAEYKAARAEADHALRRYRELQQSLHELEQQSAEQARVEVDRHREAANIAWKTAEEEAEHLEWELNDLRRQFEREREERRQLERSWRQQEENNDRVEQEHRRLISRLNRALKLSEDRRRRAEAAGQPSLRSGRSANPSSFAKPANATHEVDPAAGWGNVPLAVSADMADEFLSVAEDCSLDTSDLECSPPGLAAEPDSVSDTEAEVLIMELNVTEQVERRHAAVAARQSVVGRVSSSDSPAFWLTWKWLALTGIVAAFAVAAIILQF
ncbi:coiled-coil domain-containing protein [Nitrococcus mobilis]|uniref:Uncharacterized protein n=1 Tax=Nitrococcus mobilis Nb-231 TaxID=314278 RepID=A4BSF0_9GAMM|nr:hypothetical protein [Nitrococcus mobilis]EAR21410.1 hypothetical protein NB231_13486 [Nitrococcus mobilis Nb-231]